MASATIPTIPLLLTAQPLLCSLFCPGCVERLGQGSDRDGDESSLPLGNSVDNIVICRLSITEIGLKPRHPVAGRRL